MAQSKYKIFSTVVEMGSLTRAAEKCGVTQSAVSHALHALESEAGFPLIIRNRSGVRLTPEGEKLLPAIRRIVEALDAFHTEVSALRGQEGGCFRIGAFTSVAVHWLPRIIKDYQALHPQVDFRMLGGDPDGKIHKLLEFAGSRGDVADPWYSDRFDIAWRDIYDGCAGLLETLLGEQ